MSESRMGERANDGSRGTGFEITAITSTGDAADLIGQARSISVLLVDNDRLLRAAVSAAMQADQRLVVVGHADDGAEALKQAQSLRPAVTLAGARLHDPIGNVELTTRLTRMGTAVVILTPHHEIDEVIDVLLAGARGYLLRDCPEKLIRQAVREVAAGEAFLHPVVTAQLLRFLTRTALRARPVPVQRVESLTARELQVLRALGEGMPPYRIAVTLGIKLATVRSHISHLLHKLRVATALEAVAVAHQAGLLEPNHWPPLP